VLKKTFWQQFPHLTAVLQALFVTFLWSTSWVFIKIGLVEIPPLIFAGLRYSLAFLFLLPIFYRSNGLAGLRTLSRQSWTYLLGLGVILYGLTQGAQFVALAYLPAVTVNLLWGFSSIAVALLGIMLLSERPSGQQWLGVGISILGILIYFYPVQLPSEAVIGLIAAGVGVLANAGAAVLGRYVNRDRQLSPLMITMVSMGIGAVLLLSTGLAFQAWPTLSWQSWAIIGWLALINTAFAFTLWNHTLRTLSAMESSVVNNAMAIQIPILAVIFLGERLTGRELLGLVIAIVGVALVQLGRSRWSAKE
jgi:drug/metabolite transporter (DMT)-like permease